MWCSALCCEYVDAEGEAGTGVQLISIVNAHLDLESERWIVDQVDVRPDEDGRCGG
ncbi:hypothetical protein ACH0AH_04040 [Microbacterium paludicola]|uniref:hypothetical protein n=1 Tax=Microbacterium paludicola TaxID=300019 RepID=UPI00387A5897